MKDNLPLEAYMIPLGRRFTIEPCDNMSIGCRNGKITYFDPLGRPEKEGVVWCIACKGGREIKKVYL